MTIETIFVAVTHASGAVTRLQIFASAPAASFSPDAARQHGFALKGGRWVRDVSDEQIAAEVARSVFVDGSPVVSWKRCAPTDFPVQDRDFRGAWRMRDGKIGVDMPAARGIHRDRMRQARAPRLAALDVEYQRADEAGDGAAKRAIGARKQALRDVTADPRIDAADTPDALRAVWSADLD